LLVLYPNLFTGTGSPIIKRSVPARRPAAAVGLPPRRRRCGSNRAPEGLTGPGVPQWFQPAWQPAH